MLFKKIRLGVRFREAQDRLREAEEEVAERRETKSDCMTSLYKEIEGLKVSEEAEWRLKMTIEDYALAYAREYYADVCKKSIEYELSEIRRELSGK